MNQDEPFLNNPSSSKESPPKKAEIPKDKQVIEKNLKKYEKDHASHSQPLEVDDMQKEGDAKDYSRLRKRFTYRKKECYFKKNQVTYIDFKDVTMLSRFISKNGRITPPRFTGTSKIYQRKLAKAIKQARYMALLPYIDNRG